MNKGKTLNELAAEITRQAKSKQDFLVDTRALSMRAESNSGMKFDAPVLSFGDHLMPIGGVAHDQIGSHCDIPAKYYDKMLADSPALLADNVNHWFARSPSKQMLRCLDGQTRGFLSQKYRCLDNYDLAEVAIEELLKLDVEVVSSDITEKRLYIKAVDKKVIREIPAGHAMGDGTHTIVKARKLSPSITISNSEIGYGRLMVQGGTFDEFCTNLAIFDKRSLKKHHIGSKIELAGDNLWGMLSDETRRADDKALWLTVRDIIRGAFAEAEFDALVGEIVGTQKDLITGDIPTVVEVTAKRFGMNEGERKSVLDNLIRGGDTSRFGLYNAITRTAEDLADYDRATEFERFGGQVIELARRDWEVLAKAA